jgi:hypothetical protein
MAWRHQIDVVYASSLQIHEDSRQFLGCRVNAVSKLTDIVVLAKNATQITARKENSA